MAKEFLDDMVLFAEVVRDGSFSKAARRLDVSASSLSKSIRRLEDRLAARLLHRTTRALQLTEIGRSYHAHCARIVSEIEASKVSISQLSAEPMGTLRVTVPVGYGQRRVLPLLPELMAQHPKLTVHINLENRVVDLATSDYDVAIRITGKADDSSMVARRVGRDRRVVCGSPSYYRNFGHPDTPGDLVRHNCLIYGLRRPQWWFAGPSGDFSVAVSGTLVTNHAEAQKIAALGGAGLAWLSHFAIDSELGQGTLIASLEPFSSARRSIYILYHHRDHLSPKVRAFVDFFTRRLESS